jgi:hypothetical protein
MVVNLQFVMGLLGQTGRYELSYKDFVLWEVTVLT